MFGFNKDQMPEQNKLVIKSVAYSLLAIFFILFLVFVLVYANRAHIFSSLAREYTRENTARMTAGDDSLGAVFSEESRVVSVTEESLPSVVSITVSREMPVYERATGFGGFTYEQHGVQEQEIGRSSGFFVSSDGLIVTNKHVVSSEDASSYHIITNEGERYEAEVVAQDPFIDIAFLQVQDARGVVFKPLAFSDEENPRLGQTVIAIGNALGEFQNTISVGVVSGLSRSIFAQGQMGIERLEQVIQTDAALNPGNSGGPLISLSGEVVGVNVAVAEDTENIAFAIPANFVKKLVDSVRETGEIIRPFIGVRYVPVSSVSDLNSLPVETGVLVTSREAGLPAVLPGSPADKAGIREGDIILSVNNKEVNTDQSFGFLVRQLNVGEAATLEILRNEGRITLEVELGKAPENIKL